MPLPEISNYGNYSSDNYGAHSLRVDIGGLVLYFSYRTVIAFRAPGHSLVVSQNDWGPTTGKHLNWIDNGHTKDRLPREQFESRLSAVLKEHGLL